MVFQISKRNLVRAASFLLAFILAGFGGWIYSENRAKTLKRELVHKYEASLEEIASGIKNMSVLLNKSLYVSTPYGMCSLISELEALSGKTLGAMASFPSGIKGGENIAKFVNQVSDFSAVLLRQTLEGKEITEKERESLKNLSESAKAINTKLDEALIIYNNKENWENRVEGILQKIEVQDDFGVSIDKIAETLQSSPTLIYDGPFSDHIDNKESALIKNSEEVSEESAKKTAAKFLNLSEENINLLGNEEGKIPSYCFGNENAYISVAKNGGFVNYFRNSREVGHGTISNEQAVELAAKFLKENLKQEFEATYFFSEENVCVINFAFLQGEVLCYPDLIKVGVALDNGEIVFYEGRGYIMNHTARTFSEPTNTVSKAKEMVSSHLEIEKERLVIIPTSGGGEKLCFEFLTKGEEDENILIYINAHTLLEEDVLVLIRTEGGTLTK